MTNPTGESPASHEGTYLDSEIPPEGPPPPLPSLPPDEGDDEVLTMTRRDLRILLRTLSTETLKVARKNYVRLDTITPEEVAR